MSKAIAAGSEIAGLPFDKILGTPLKSAIEAQVRIAISITNYIRRNGFEGGPAIGIAEDSGMPIVLPISGKAATMEMNFVRNMADGSKKPMKIKIPFLTMMPIPNLKLTSMTVNLKVEITGNDHRSEDISFSGSAGGVSGPTFSGFAGARMSVTHTNSNSYTEERTYTMNISVNAQAAETPRGIDKLLTAMNDAVYEKPA
mmetsp:Transcript_20688/g.52375  ORF Transcript_20688/g.52375 Transcript_20688/m.52375 type:complete len:200 (+) Transcript_20688:263-862(+)|eukprot:CAMPEP_0177682928 /NCGR_PEP_ID=MMETSP0447-20121125/31514_1 /TAXON_ID=0 /ORGANISM="Stygamoeba regulata, Strain BSH-02190019" /LENGTH=199 /DNA_ID=CAMNT_0019192451 /DNA_START=187 /DNA_END=786 /DNA_ORIENTATION=-